MADRLTANQWLGANGSITSPNGYVAIYQGDGNFVVYDGNQVASWDAGTAGTSTGQVIMQGDGNLVMYDAGGGVPWATGTDGNPGAQVIMQGDGNLVVYAADGTALWASQDQDQGGGFLSDIGGAIAGVASAVVDAAQTVANAVVDTAEGIASPVLNLAGMIVGAIESIPVIGRAIAYVINTVNDIVARILSIPDIILTLIGIMPEKRMKIMVIVQKTPDGPVADLQRVRQYIQEMIDVYKSECNVRVLPAVPFHYSSPFQGTPQVTDAYFAVPDGYAEENTLEVKCGTAGWTDDLGITSGNGPAFQLMMNTGKGFWGAYRRVIGYGAPVTAFTVEAFVDGHDGCSESVFTDYVLVHVKAEQRGVPDPPRLLTLAHEMGHACGLWHTDETVMESGYGTRAPTFNKIQKIVIRSSRHVTYL